MASCGLLSSSSTSDEQLAQGVREGDDRAFELLYRRYREPLSRYAGRLLRDPPAGEDAAQVALTNAYRALRAGRMPRAVRPWLYRIARNAAWRLHRERGNAVALPAGLESRSEPVADNAAALNAAVARLPERQRAVFVLRELRGASNSEAAALLALRESQVEQLLFAGRARLAELLLFGESVTCATVRAAATIQLGRQERRAFKRHAHHCAECRMLLGGRLKLRARLVWPLEALRRLAEIVIGAGAPAKAGVAAALAVAASAPLVLPAVHGEDGPVGRPDITAVVPPTRQVAAARPTRVQLPAARATPLTHAVERVERAAPVAVKRPAAPARSPSPRPAVAVATPVPVTRRQEPALPQPPSVAAPATREPGATTTSAARTPRRAVVRPARRAVSPRAVTRQAVTLRPVAERAMTREPPAERPSDERVVAQAPPSTRTSELTVERVEQTTVAAEPPPSADPAPPAETDPAPPPERSAR